MRAWSFSVNKSSLHPNRALTCAVFRPFSLVWRLQASRHRWNRSRPKSYQPAINQLSTNRQHIYHVLVREVAPTHQVVFDCG